MPNPEAVRLHLRDAALSDLKGRLPRTRLPGQAPGESWAETRLNRIDLIGRPADGHELTKS